MRKHLVRASDEEVLRYGRARGWPPMRGGGDFRLSDGMVFVQAGMVDASTAGTRPFNGSTVNTKGSWTQLIASTTFDTTDLLLFAPGPTASVAQQILMDIGVGPAGSEVVVIPNVIAPTVFAATAVWHFPISIPAGSRLAVRSQGTVANGSAGAAAVGLISEGFGSESAWSKVTDYGTVTASSRGTNVATGSSAGNKGAWVEIVSSTSDPMKEMAIAIAETGAHNSLWDIGIGASGSEQVLLNDLASGGISTTGYTVNAYSRLPVSLPAGTRIAARSQSSVAPISTENIIVYGIN